jgi:Holliday junction resolvase-like predicted endonuclease
MPFDTDSGHANEPTAGSPAHTHSASRAARPLGRGLEDVSHFFFPGTSEGGGPAPPSDRATERDDARPAIRAGAAVLRPRDTISRELLTATLRECQSALEENLRVIDARFPCHPYGEIDLLAVDRANVLTIIDVDTVLGDGLLLRGTSHVDWIVRNLAHVRRMYQASSIDFSRQPRLVFVAPKFSFLQGAVRQIAGLDIRCFKYQAVELSGGTGILFERLRSEDE